MANGEKSLFAVASRGPKAFAPMACDGDDLRKRQRQ
jgi:hypothetical protein